MIDIPPGTRTILIDGRSGSGKTTLANNLGAELGWHVVHLDDLYPGWSGLVAGARMVATDVLHPTSPGFWRWDWRADRPGEWVPLDPAAPLIVEGVGAYTLDSWNAASRRGGVFTIRLECPLNVRKERALSRDPEFAEWWDVWAQQELTLLDKELPADLTLHCDC